MANINFSFRDILLNFKDDMLKSRKYWIICLVLILISFFAMMEMENYAHPKMEIAVLILSSILSVIFISFYSGHRDDGNFYKTVFVVIFIFGIVFSVLTPIMCTHDEIEHFVRAEITSNSVINPEFNETQFDLDGITYDGFYWTIQSTFDLTKKGVVPSWYSDVYVKNTPNLTTEDKGFVDYIEMDMVKSSVLNTEADTQPINATPVKFPSAFAQNPFFGYVAPAIGIALAKLLDLNAVWMMWLGRIFNALLYAVIVSYAIRKTPTLKIPLFVVACIPATLSQASSISIDPIINGLAILAIAIFLRYYKSPKNSLDHKSIVKFAVLVLLLGMCKVTYFSFMFLLLFLPRGNFKEDKYYYMNVLAIAISLVIVLLWTKLFVDPGIHNSWRYSLYFSKFNVDTASQIAYVLDHKREAFINMVHVFTYLDDDLTCSSFFITKYNSLFLIFTGAVYLLYPHEKFSLKSKIGALLVFCIIYFGTYFLFVLTWNPVGSLYPNPNGVQSRYFFPALALVPIFLGFNHIKGDTTEIDSYIVMLTIAFIVFRILAMTIMVY